MLSINMTEELPFNQTSKMFFLRMACIHFWPQPTNSDSGELFRMKLFVYIDG